MRRDDDTVLPLAHGELEALVRLGEHVVPLAGARIDAMHLARSVELVNRREVELAVGPGAGVVGAVDLGPDVLARGHVAEAQGVALGPREIDRVGEKAVTPVRGGFADPPGFRLHDPGGGVRRSEGSQVDEELIARGSTSSQFRQLAPRRRKAVVGMGTVIPADRAFSIGRARHELREDLRRQWREAHDARVVGRALGLQVGEHSGVIAHPGIGIGAGVAGSYGDRHASTLRGR